MKRHPYRWLIIILVLAWAVINIVPTVGWMLLDEQAKTERLEQWKAEDEERLALEPAFIQDTGFAIKRWSEFDRDKVINLGLDLQGGIHMVIGFDWHDLPEERITELKEVNKYTEAQIAEEIQIGTVDKIRRRVNEFEAKEPIIQALGTNQIQIQLPGEKDIVRAKELITKAAILNFHIAAENDEMVVAMNQLRSKEPNFNEKFLTPPISKNTPVRVQAGQPYAVIRDIVDRANTTPGHLPEGKLLLFSTPPKPSDADQFYDLYLVDKEPIQSGEGLDSAASVRDATGKAEIDFSFIPSAASNFGTVTEQNMGRAMAIVVDNQVMSAPTIQGKITSRGSITGNFTDIEARDLAIVLNSGSMDVEVHEELSMVVGASLGEESVRKGVSSAVIGIAIVGVFMVIYYHLAGIVAVISLLVNALLVIGSMAYFGMTLTLPGIAGLILTVGMAVDANVLIYERIREELRLGHALVNSIENGFSRATVTILDANVTTLIAALVLFQFGSGPIQGFAVTLSIGVCASVFAALVVSHAIFDFLAGSKMISKVTMLSIVKADTKVGFLNGRKIAFIFSAVFIAIGLGFFGVRYNAGHMLGVDFTEGTNLHIALHGEAPVSDAQVREALTDANFDGPIVQRAGDDESTDEFLIRVRNTKDMVDAEGAFKPVAGTISGVLGPLVSGVDNVEVMSEQTVGPAVGKQLRRDAILAVIFSLIFIVFYLTIRFEWKFALGAIIALTHDVLITLGIFALAGREISMPVVAAVLTIIGYSLNDTIVVFDRIREDIQFY